MTRKEREYEWAKAAYLRAMERLRKAKAALLHGKPGAHQFGPPTPQEWAMAELSKDREFDAFCEEQRIIVTWPPP